MASFEFLIGEGFLKFTSIETVPELYEILKAAKNLGIIYHEGQPTGSGTHLHMLYHLEKNTNTKIKRVHTCLKAALGPHITDEDSLYEYLKLIAVKIPPQSLLNLCNNWLATPQLREHQNLGIQGLAFNLSPLGKALHRVLHQGCSTSNPRPCLSHLKANTLASAQVTDGAEAHHEDQIHEGFNEVQENSSKLACPKNEARWDLISDLIEDTRTDSVGQLQRVMPEDEYKKLALKCGLNWKALVGQVFEAKLYGALNLENGLNYFQVHSQLTNK